jgi:hypothetical protein
MEGKMGSEELMAAVLAVVLFYFVVGAVLLVIGIAIARFVWDRYEYRVFLNEVNLLNVAGLACFVAAAVLAWGQVEAGDYQRPTPARYDHLTREPSALSVGIPESSAIEPDIIATDPQASAEKPLAVTTDADTATEIKR